jgi:uncharacterized protein
MISPIHEHVGGIAVQELDGSWERAHRNITAAAFIGLLIVGVIYFYAQSIIAGVLIVVNIFKDHAPSTGKTFIQQLVQTMRVMKMPVRYALFISQLAFMLVPTIWIVRRWHTVHVLSYIRFARVSVLEVILAVAASLCFIQLGGCIVTFLATQLNVPDFLAQINAEVYASYSRPELTWVVFVVCVAPAICEEVLFRGYVQRTLERTMGIRSIYIVGIVFGLYHMQPLSLITLSLLGIMIGFFSYRSKSIVPGMAAHFTNNLLVVLSLYKNAAGRRVFGIFEYEMSPIGILAVLVVGIGVLYFYTVITRKNIAVRE